MFLLILHQMLIMKGLSVLSPRGYPVSSSSFSLFRANGEVAN